MANNCDTVYRIVAEKTALDKLEATIRKATKQNPWLGNIVKQLNGDVQNMQCRGTLECMERENNGAVLTLYCDTAWTEMPDFRHFIEKTCNAAVFYTAVEPGCGVFLTNDDNYIGKWHVDSDLLDYGDFLTEDELVNAVREVYKADVNDIKDVLDFADWFNRQHPDGEQWMYFNQMERED